MDNPAVIVSQNPPSAGLDLAAIKTRQQGAWSSGDYAVVGTTLQIVGEELSLPVARIDLVEGDSALTPNQGPTAGSSGARNMSIECCEPPRPISWCATSSTRRPNSWARRNWPTRWRTWPRPTAPGCGRWSAMRC